MSKGLIAIIVIILIAAIILKAVGKKKNSKAMRIAGNVFLVLGVINAIPVVLVVGSLAFNSVFTKITLPDEKEAFVLSKDISTMRELAVMDSDDALAKLDKLLKRSPELVYYLDVNRKGILDYGLENGNSEVVEIALKNGAIFDDSNRYEHMAYVCCSMDYYLGELTGREITEDDVRIIRLMFENDARTDYKNAHHLVYSNLFGRAVWAVLYNDEAVTDTEIDFIQVFLDNGLSSDSALLLFDEKPSNVFFSPEYNADVLRDENYSRIMAIIGK